MQQRRFVASVPPSRRRALIAGVGVALAAAVAPSPAARADAGSATGGGSTAASAMTSGDAAPEPGDTKAVAYSYEIENADVRSDKVVIVWPRVCSSKGEPPGKVDLTPDPEGKPRGGDVDYEVIVKGTRHTVHEHCSTRVYALPAEAFALGTRTATPDDLALGQEAGAPLPTLPALDAFDRRARLDLLTTDPRVLRSSFRFEPMKPVRQEAALAGVHDVLAIDIGVTALSVIAKRAIYKYDDGSLETVEYVGAKRPLPSRGNLGDAADGDAATNARLNVEGGASSDASAVATAPPNAAAVQPPGESPPPVSHDLGTRWVLLAAVGGLVVGGLLAHRRRKRTPPP